jgi:SAM-dependent methyltransferase
MKIGAPSASAEESSPSPGDRTRVHSLRQMAAPYATIAPLYDAILGDRFFPQLRRVFERLVRRYSIPFSSAADVACGTGTFVRYLCERGVPVVYGVDRSPDMLRVAIAKNQGSHARFLLQDFATLQLPQPVDLITCHFDSLNYALTTDDLLRALRRFHANVKPAGHVIFDMITGRPPGQGLGPRVERVTGRGVSIVRNTRWDPRRRIQTALVTISRNGGSQQEIHLQRGYPVAVVARLLAQARFAVLGVHDFQTLGPATAWTPRAVYVAGAWAN